jgi:hypothetical protein
MFIGSVSANIVNNSADTPVWLVDEEGASQDIMVAVDGSESSFKAVDHLAFIVGGNTDLKISFFPGYTHYMWTLKKRNIF